MKFNELTLSRAKKAKRAGRGISAGRGKTAGRGTKGQGSRKSPTKQGFAGGQTPLIMQLPKLRGFKSKRPVVENVYTGQLNDLKQPAIDTSVLAKEGLISSPHVNVKLITKGELKAKKIVKLPSASSSAVEAIAKAGGSFEAVPRLARAKKAPPKTE